MRTAHTIPGAPSARGSVHVEWLSAPKPYAFETEWFDEGGQDNFWMQWRLRAFLAQLAAVAQPLDTPLRVLDVGCGIGVLREQLTIESAWTIDGADVDAAALDRCPAGRGRILYYDILEKQRDLTGQYDAVILFDVIEHLADPIPFIAAAAAHLKPRGRLFINVPALECLFSAYDEAVGHLRRYDSASLTREVNAAGLMTLDLRYWGLTLLPLLALRRLLIGRNLRSEADRNRIIRKGWHPPPGTKGLLKALMYGDTPFRRPWLGTSLLCACEPAEGRSGRPGEK